MGLGRGQALSQLATRYPEKLGGASLGDTVVIAKLHASAIVKISEQKSTFIA